MLEKLIENHEDSKSGEFKRGFIPGLIGMAVAVIILNLGNVNTVKLSAAYVMPIILSFVAFFITERMFVRYFLSDNLITKKSGNVEIGVIQFGRGVGTTFPLPAYIKNHRDCFFVDVDRITINMEYGIPKALLNVRFREFYSKEIVAEFWNKVRGEEVVIIDNKGKAGKATLPMNLTSAINFESPLEFQAEIKPH